VNDADWLNQAVALSREGMERNDGGPFGAVVVADNSVVATGNNRVTSTNDPTAHAEVVAIREACAKLGRFDLRGAVLYTSCEPCPMCLAAAYWARVDRIVYANTREAAAAIGFDDALIYDEIPLEPAQRKLSMTHLPSADASAVFSQWQQKEDRVDY